jgi:O-succinylbenzoic acid--CoA ligase
VVVRAPSSEWGEVPVVFSAGRASLESVKATVVTRLGRASAPVAIVTVASVPLLPSGKPDRVSLTAFAASRGVSPGRQ